MKLGTYLNLTNSLSMTPELQQAVKILQLSALDLNAEIQKIFEENPLIEKKDDCKELSLGECSSHYLHYSGMKNNFEPNKISEIIEKTYTSERSLKEHLEWQIELINLSDKDKNIAKIIIDYINPNGYISCSIESIYEELLKDEDTSIDEIFAIQHLIQSLDPVGCGSTDIQECLLAQLNASHNDNKKTQVAISIIKDFFNEFSNDKVNLIKNSLKISNELFNDCKEIIKDLNPKPGNLINSHDETQYIIPDIYVKKDNKGWKIETNKQLSPTIEINSYYLELTKEIKNEKDKKYISDNLQKAKWFIKNLNYRNDNLLLLVRAIFNKQLPFFDKGPEFLTPLTLKDIASEINVHESTVSRLSNGKYIDTPHGIFEIKYFFSSKITSKLGGHISSNSIKETIKKIIDNEDKVKPYSDEKIKEILEENELDIARRTIAKYREKIGYGPAHERKIKKL